MNTATDDRAAVAAYDAALSKEVDARRAFNAARRAALNAAPRELWARANNAICDAIDAAPAAERDAARAAADVYLAATEAANTAYKALSPPRPRPPEQST